MSSSPKSILTTLKAKANNGWVKNDCEIAVSSMDPLLVIEPDIFDKSHFVMLSKKYQIVPHGKEIGKNMMKYSEKKWTKTKEK